MSTHMLLERDILGPDGAQDDQNLLSYYYERKNKNNRAYIYVGGWGSGKTTSLLYKSNNLMKFLYGKILFDDPFKRPWYIEESQLNILRLSEIFSSEKDNVRRRSALLSQMWEVEIIRRVVLQLELIRNKANEDNTVLSGIHWENVKFESFKKHLPEGVWSNISKVITIVAPDSKHAKVASGLIEFFEEVISLNHYRYINLCIKDLIDKGMPIPFVAVEPIETPYSEAENDISFAQTLINTLLDCWFQKFRPSKIGNNISVYISIPWHRYDIQAISFTHRVNEYVEKICWDKSDLKKFINKRIMWEFKNNGMIFSSGRDFSDPWDIIFQGKIDNKSCQNKANRSESAFDYIVRHTCWRPRDLLILTRACIDEYCQSQSYNQKLFFEKGVPIDGAIVKNAVSKKIQGIADWRFEEFQRKYGNKEYIKKCLIGIESPFTLSELEGRLRTEKPNISALDIWQDVINPLWNADIIGVCVEAENEAEESRLSASYSNDTKLLVKGVRRDYTLISDVGFLFNYSTEFQDEPIKIIEEFSRSSFIIHPIFNEKLGIKVHADYPIGR